MNYNTSSSSRSFASSVEGHEKVQLFVSCRDLPKMDLMSESDPFVVLFLREPHQRKFIEVGRTETLPNTPNPDFVTEFSMKYIFEAKQELLFRVYDRDSKSEDLKKHDLIGSVVTTMSRVFGSHNSVFAANLLTEQSKVTKGKIIVRGEQSEANLHNVSMRFSANKLAHKSFLGLGSCNAFVRLSRTNEDNHHTRVWMNQPVKSSHSVHEWPAFEISARKLCNQDFHRPILVEVFDHESNGKHKLIGSFETSVDELKDGARSKKSFLLVNEEKKNKKGSKYKGAGEFIVHDFKVKRVYSFIEYIQGGTNIEMSIAIDFTGSNKEPSTPRSLHYVSPSNYNQYQQAIMSVGSIIEDYDTDKMIPVYGFGARYKGVLSHCFPVSCDENQESLHGIAGVLNAYSQVIPQISFSGPTLFAPIINATSERIRREALGERLGESYHVLLILTDGIINDFSKTVDAIVDASSLPLSIIIAGIGNADFGEMDRLDGDDALLVDSCGRRAQRDIVQFVPMRKFIVGGQVSSLDTALGEALAEATLEEVPEQLCQFMKKRNVVPRERSQVFQPGQDFAVATVIAEPVALPSSASLYPLVM